MITARLFHGQEKKRKGGKKKEKKKSLAMIWSISATLGLIRSCSRDQGSACASADTSRSKPTRGLLTNQHTGSVPSGPEELQGFSLSAKNSPPALKFTSEERGGCRGRSRSRASCAGRRSPGRERTQPHHSLLGHSPQPGSVTALSPSTARAYHPPFIIPFPSEGRWCL